jgi:hypothetical protein
MWMQLFPHYTVFCFPSPKYWYKHCCYLFSIWPQADKMSRNRRDCPLPTKLHCPPSCQSSKCKAIHSSLLSRVTALYRSLHQISSSLSFQSMPLLRYFSKSLLCPSSVSHDSVVLYTFRIKLIQNAPSWAPTHWPSCFISQHHPSAHFFPNLGLSLCCVLWSPSCPTRSWQRSNGSYPVKSFSSPNWNHPLFGTLWPSLIQFSWSLYNFFQL